MDNQTDHDKIVTLVTEVRNLQRSQDDFHIEMRTSMKELQDNYSGRINTLDTRVKNLEFKNNWFMGALALIGVCSSLVIYIYLSQQEVQNANIEKAMEYQQFHN